MVGVGLGDRDGVTVVVGHFDIGTDTVYHLLERNLVRYVFAFRLVHGIFPFQHQVTVVVLRTRESVESTFGQVGRSRQFIGSLLCIGQNRAFGIGDQVGLCFADRLDREELRPFPSVAHRHFLEGELRLRGIVHDIETGHHTGELEADLRTGGTSEVGQVERRNIGTRHGQR